jgi:hypothetical protein
MENRFQNSDYEILNINEGLELMNRYNLNRKNDIGLKKFNEDLLLIFNLPEDQFLVMPNSYNLNLIKKCNICYLVKSESLLKDWIDNESFPEDCNEIRVFQKHQDYVLNINKHTPEVLAYFLKNYGIDLSKEISIKDIELIYNQTKHKGSDKFDKSFLYSAPAICLFVKQKYNCKWVLLKDRGNFNKYYKPALVDDLGHLYLIFENLEGIKADKFELRFELFKNWHLIRKPNIRLSELSISNIKTTIPSIIYLE